MSPREGCLPVGEEAASWVGWDWVGGRRLGVGDWRDHEGEWFCGFGANGAALAERGRGEEVTVAAAMTGTDTEAAVERGSWASSKGKRSELSLVRQGPHGLGKTAQIL